MDKKKEGMSFFNRNRIGMFVDYGGLFFVDLYFLFLCDCGRRLTLRKISQFWDYMFIYWTVGIGWD